MYDLEISTTPIGSTALHGHNQGKNKHKNKASFECFLQADAEALHTYLHDMQSAFTQNVKVLRRSATIYSLLSECAINQAGFSKQPRRGFIFPQPGPAPTQLLHSNEMDLTQGHIAKWADFTISAYEKLPAAVAMAARI